MYKRAVADSQDTERRGRGEERRDTRTICIPYCGIGGTSTSTPAPNSEPLIVAGLLYTFLYIYHI
jgi:hypothetical protein